MCVNAKQMTTTPRIYALKHGTLSRLASWHLAVRKRQAAKAVTRNCQVTTRSRPARPDASRQQTRASYAISSLCACDQKEHTLHPNVGICNRLKTFYTKELLISNNNDGHTTPPPRGGSAMGQPRNANTPRGDHMLPSAYSTIKIIHRTWAESTGVRLASKDKAPTS